MTLFDAQPGRKLKPLQVGAQDIEAWLLARDPTAIGAYHSIGAEEYARSFTAAKTAGADVIDDLYFSFVDVVSRSGTEQDFSKLVVPILKQKGWLGGDDGAIANRVGLIYGTNLRLARAAGRWTNFQQTKGSFPYIRGYTAEDEDVRHPPKSKHSDHRAWDGIIRRADDPFWLTYWTPLGFRCRCGVMQLSRADLIRYKGDLTTDADLADRIERLGPPIFLAPGAPIGAQIASMVVASNEEPMPGRPPIDPVQTEARGRAMWNAVLIEQAFDQVGETLAKLFGL